MIKITVLALFGGLVLATPMLFAGCIQNENDTLAGVGYFLSFILSLPWNIPALFIGFSLADQAANYLYIPCSPNNGDSYSGLRYAIWFSLTTGMFINGALLSAIIFTKKRV